MAISQKKLREEREKLFPSMYFRGEDPMDPDGPAPKPIPLDEFLKAVRKRFPGKPFKDLLVSFNDFELTVTHSTAEARAKEAELCNTNQRVRRSVLVSAKAHRAAELGRWLGRRSDDELGRDEWIGNLVESRIQSLESAVVEAHSERLHREDVSTPLAADEALRVIARMRGVSISALVSCALEAWADEQGQTAKSA